MIGKYQVLALIPARGGSKRLSGKNIKELHGKPLIAYSIEHAKGASCIDRIIVSTDNAEIAAIAKKWGAEVPFMRPAELAADDTVDFPVFHQALAWLHEHEAYRPDIVVQLRPTSPLRTLEHIDKAVELLTKHPDADSVRTVTKPEHSPYKMYTISTKGYLKPLMSLNDKETGIHLPDQKLPTVYRHVGYVDTMWASTILEKKSIAGDHILPLVLEQAYGGINTLEEWEWYEYLLRSN
jgi:N-acylneuraminate cytidylyltransferase